MNLRSVLHLQGWLLIFLGGAMLTPIPFSLYYRSGDLSAFLISALVTIVAGLIVIRCTDIERDVRVREGFAIVTFGWLLAAAFGALPFVLSGAIPSYTDAFFETMSGFTTTGASILTDIEALPRGALFWRSFTHWLGGMGIILLSLAILPFLGVGGMQLFKAEVPGPVADKLAPRVTQTAKILWAVYIVLSALQTVLLMLGGMDLFDALCHTFGTMATGGFSTRNASIAAYPSPYIQWVIIVFMFLAGVNFALHYRVLQRGFNSYRYDREFIVYTAFIVVASILIFGFAMLREGQFNEKAVRDVVFQVVSIQTTTGYVTFDYERWPFAAQMVLFLLMFVGGSAGSTGGGMKVLRIYLLIKFVFAELNRLIHPHAIVPVRMRGQTIPRDVMTNVLGFAVLYIVIFFLGALLVAAAGHDMPTAFGAVIATLSNVGPGLGDVGAVDNYSALHPAVKWLLAFFMLLGRLELYTVLILFAPAYWRR
ncbi:TrkH family potassium uptake protein [Caldilinea sp.]|uniref:TrkH family potassium uptake protein n=1 Tax=Caldilinea sp. TaxID=2293560 RepID=UPI00262723CB|nr:potassium transporter TrkG [uncultured Caldilinea sp.]